MPSNKVVERYRRMDLLIRTKATGNPEEFARKFAISKRMLHEYINDLSALDAPIEYSKPSNSHIYKREGRFEIAFRDN